MNVPRVRIANLPMSVYTHDDPGGDLLGGIELFAGYVWWKRLTHAPGKQQTVDLTVCVYVADGHVPKYSTQVEALLGDTVAISRADWARSYLTYLASTAT